MANREACELYIDQQIDEAIQGGKTPSAIGKELSEMIQWLFETKIKPRTLEQRARRRMSATNVANESGDENNYDKSAVDAVRAVEAADPKNERPQCNCGNLCKVTRKRKDGTFGYHDKCQSCLMGTKPHPESSQHAIWIEIEKRLRSVADFAMENCRVPSKTVANGLKLKIESAISVITTLIIEDWRD